MKLFLLLLTILAPLMGSIQEKQNSKPFLVLTIPKSGTHLLKKLFDTIQNREMLELNVDFRTNVFANKLEKSLDSGKYFMAHLLRSQPLTHYFKTHPTTPLILQIRDLRDVLVSCIYYEWDNIEKEFGPTTFEQKLALFFQTGFRKLWIFDLKAKAEEALFWMAKPNVILSRFEKLIGPQGGGDADQQKKLVLKIANAIGISMDANFLEKTCQELFGNKTSFHSKTFRKGQIGSWRDHFTSEDLSLFNERFGSFQLALGYTLN